MKYKVGDKVRVKPLGELALCECVVTEMLKFAGMVTTITAVSVWGENDYYIEDGEGWYWDEDCFTDDVDYEKANPAISLQEKVSELETRVSELERKLEQVIRDA